jgi:hypothetical protein
MNEIGKAKIERIAKHARRNVQVNSGALLQIDLEDETVEIVEPSASGHRSPRYEFSGEAPRVYDDEPVTMSVWRSWVEWVIEQEGEYQAEQDAYIAYLESFG